MIKQNYDVLIPHARAEKRLHIERDQAEALFKKFISEGFCYDDISNNPDWPAYASAEFLMDLLPWIIDEMLKRKDTGNFLIYPMLSSINIENAITSYQERAKKVIELADKSFTEKVCQFLDALKDEPPIEEDEFERIYTFWKNKME